MQIIQFGESSNNKNIISVGIDFGTTHSLVSIYEDSDYILLKDKKGRNLIPSVIDFELGDISTSDQNDIYQIKTSNSPVNCIVAPEKKSLKSIISVKRLLAKSTSEILANSTFLSLLGNMLDLSHSNQKLPQIKIEQLDKSSKKDNVTLIDISAQLFKYLKNMVLDHIKNTNKDLDHKNLDIQAVISVPAHFNSSAKGQIMQAARMAGLNVTRLIAEPTAAAYAYGMNVGENHMFVVYDLGGGTFDISILKMHHGVLKTIAVGGDEILGGDDIDYLLVDYIKNEYQNLYDDLLKSHKISEARKILKDFAKNIKHELSYNQTVTKKLLSYEVKITIDVFENLISDFVNKTINIVKATIAELEDITLIDAVILVGGSSRIPMISKKLRGLFNSKIPIISNINPDHVVAIGAGMQAHNLHNGSGKLLVDVVPLSLGIELYGGIAEKIIMRNTTMPCSISKEFTTQADDQTAMIIHCVQGEREMVNDCHSLGIFELNNLPPMKAGMVKVKVTFSLDVDGILSVIAEDSISGNMQMIEIKPTYGMSDSDIADKLDEAYKYAKEDHDGKLLAYTKIEAMQLVKNMLYALDETPDLLSKEEYQNIVKELNELESLCKNSDRSLIENQINLVNQIAQNFIESRLNHGLEQLVRGKNIKEI